MRTATITLAGKEYTIQRMPAMRAIAWRKRAQELLEAFPALAKDYQKKLSDDADDADAAGIEALRTVNGLLERLVDVVLDSGEAIRADRDFILENAYDDDFLGAFQVTLTLNVPLLEMASAA